MAYSPDGATVLSGSDDDTLRLWDARPLTEIADEVCIKRYIVPKAEAAMREQFAIPDDVVLCPEEQGAFAWKGSARGRV
ncbi:MAG: hypothetical protein GFH27_549293n2 [Chloroflexi bacterium AL-W]|nr:hypothetical protein [Chloroflexi bacterium AL-N1]NOK67883.1 hypothetical protein [Chloroflexi bacterium AL-N10]NOK75347.1 hypothetical protein [Chloroflexi bacterium AL-N5]NOK82135.1 hypothetical protein [Chloroflexi bacterium AL-W]NOK89980.1 hypothetical protein [Chloroflexi bacterium AL-N15]